MSEDFDHTREQIARDQGWTLCRCGHILECCADCRDWLVDNSPRIVRAWRWYVNHPQFEPAGQDLANYAESDDRAFAVAQGVIRP